MNLEHNFKLNGKKCVIICGAFLIIHSLGNAYISYTNYHEMQLKNEMQMQKQQDKMNDITNSLDDIHTQIQELNQIVESQKSIYTKTTARLEKKHITNDIRMIDTGNYIDNDNSNGKTSLSNRSYIRPDINTFKVRTPSAVTSFELGEVFVGTNLEGLESSFVEAELETGVNAMFLASLAINESGWGKSYLSNAHNNLFGFGAYDNNPGSAEVFSSKDECIKTVAKFLAENYCDSSGRYYVDGTISGINQVYASDSNWKYKIFNTMMMMERKIDNV